MQLTFDKGTIRIQENVRVPNSTWDERSKAYRALALYYQDIIAFLNSSGFDFQDEVLDLLPCPEQSIPDEISRMYHDKHK